MTKKEKDIINVMKKMITTYMEYAKECEYGSRRYQFYVNRIKHAQEVIWMLTDESYLQGLMDIWE